MRMCVYVVFGAIPFAAAAGPHMFICCSVGPVWPLLVFAVYRVILDSPKNKGNSAEIFLEII